MFVKQTQAVAWSTFGVVRTPPPESQRQFDQMQVELDQEADVARARFLCAVFSAADDVAANCRRKSTCLVLQQLGKEFVAANRAARNRERRI